MVMSGVFLDYLLLYRLGFVLNSEFDNLASPASQLAQGIPVFVLYKLGLQTGCAPLIFTLSWILGILASIFPIVSKGFAYCDSSPTHPLLLCSISLSMYTPIHPFFFLKINSSRLYKLFYTMIVFSQWCILEVSVQLYMQTFSSLLFIGILSSMT